MVGLRKALSSKDPIPLSMEGCVFYAPLWQETLQGSPFKSLDPYHHICTVTEATWGSQGRTFDGTNDLIDCGNNAVLYTTPNNAWAMETWFYPTVTGDNVSILGKKESPASYFIYKLSMQVGASFRYAAANVDANEMTIPALDAWYHYMVVANGSTIIPYLNGVPGTSKAAVGTLTFYNTENFMIGNRAAIVGAYFTGKQGEVRLYNRAPSAAEVMYNKLITQWRYQ